MYCESLNGEHASSEHCVDPRSTASQIKVQLAAVMDSEACRVNIALQRVFVRSSLFIVYTMHPAVLLLLAGSANKTPRDQGGPYGYDKRAWCLDEWGDVKTLRKTRYAAMVL
jgi:hypothetical protein